MANSALKKVLITGAGTGFGHEAAMRLAEKGFAVIAAVEIYGQVQTLKRQAAELGVSLQVEKLDVTKNVGDRSVLELRQDVPLKGTTSPPLRPVRGVRTTGARLISDGTAALHCGVRISPGWTADDRTPRPGRTKESRTWRCLFSPPCAIKRGGSRTRPRAG